MYSTPKPSYICGMNFTKLLHHMKMHFCLELCDPPFLVLTKKYVVYLFNLPVIKVHIFNPIKYVLPCIENVKQVTPMCIHIDKQIT